MSALPTIYVPRDVEGLRQASAELFEDSLVQREAQRALDRAEGSRDRERLAASYRSKLTLAEGYYVWLRYLLFDLDANLMAGIQIPFADLLDTEVMGLRIVRQARAEFERTHPQCGKCGELNQAFAQVCWSCGVSFKGGKPN